METLYLCDRKACEHCSPECRHTTDIYHAINFEKCDGGGYWELAELVEEVKNGES